MTEIKENPPQIAKEIKLIKKSWMSPPALKNLRGWTGHKDIYCIRIPKNEERYCAFRRSFQFRPNNPENKEMAQGT